LTAGQPGNAVGMKNMRRVVAAALLTGLLAGAAGCSASADKKDGGVKIEGKVGDDKDNGY
jgi:hypothetical protein